MEKDPIVQGINILGPINYRPNTPRNHDITFRVPRHHARGTTILILGSTGRGTNATLSQGTIIGEASEGTLLNVHIIKDKP